MTAARWQAVLQQVHWRQQQQHVVEEAPVLFYVRCHQHCHHNSSSRHCHQAGPYLQHSISDRGQAVQQQVQCRQQQQQQVEA